MNATGRCLCGSVTYRIDSEDPLPAVTLCHCSQCARWTGSMAALTACRPSELTVTGDPVWFQSSSEAKRAFCPICGASLFWQADPGNRVYVTIGTLDPPTGLTIGEHIHVADKPDWYDILDPAPQRLAE